MNIYKLILVNVKKDHIFQHKSINYRKKSSILDLYLPIQKLLKILPKISSTSTFPTIIPRCLVANQRSSAALSKSSDSVLFLKFSK